MSVDSSGGKGRWERPDYFPGRPLSRQNVFSGFRGALIPRGVLQQHAAVPARPIPLHLWDDARAGKLSPPPVCPPFLLIPPSPPAAFCSDYRLNENILPRPSSNRPNPFSPSSRCPGDYVGSRCQYPSPCSPSPCRNGGECRAVSHGNTFDFNCVCRLGFSDRLCLTPTNHACMSSPCRNGGTCDLVTLTLYRCRCPPGWSGTHE